MAALAVEARSEPESTGQKRYLDIDRDGWNDRWVAKYPEAGREVTSDSNGDGVPNFICMMLDQDPFEQPIPPQCADPLAEARRLERVRKSEVRIREILAPFLNPGLRDSAGKLTTRFERLQAKRERLLQLAAEHEAQKPAREARIQEFLDGKGRAMPASLRNRLRDVVDGRPRFSAPMSHEQAITSGILPLWPGGSAGTDLTGSETAVAMFDFGAVQTTHDQFSSGTSGVVNPPDAGARVFNFDFPGADADEHATAVATVIVGSGDPSDSTPATTTISPDTQQNQARGMAYEGGIRVYDQLFDLTGMMNLGAAAMAGTLDIVFSNHAYGTPCGWRQAHEPPNSPWTWYGDPDMGESAPGEADGDTDYKFGFYLNTRCDVIDDLVHTSEIYLPVWAAGNESVDLEWIESPEPKERGTTSAIPHVVAKTGQMLEGNGIPNRKQDSQLSSFSDSMLSNLIPEACCKNVLTVGESRTGSASSHGPTDDLRIKPEILAGYSGGSSERICALELGAFETDADSSYRRFLGSSFSAAAVTGGLALIRQRWQQLNGTGSTVLASTWKALAIASTVEGAPHLERGYGVFDAEEAIRLVEADAVGRSTGESARVVELMLEDGGSCEIVVRRLTGSTPFRVVACWTDPKGTSPSVSIDPRDRMLVNNVDVEVVPQTGSAYFPYRFRALGNYPEVLIVETGENDRDNVEVIDVDFGFDTDFTIRVTHSGDLQNGEPQPVSIIIAGAEAILPPFRILSFFETDSVNEIYTVTWLSMPGGVYQIETSPDLSDWGPIPGEFIASQSMTGVEIDMSGLNRQFVRIRQVE